MAQLILKPGREKSLLRRHPWIFSGAVARVEGDPDPGTSVLVRGGDGTPLGWAAWSPASQIVARMWSFDPGETIDRAFFRRRLEEALARRRQPLLTPAPEAMRLVNAESDGLPGVVVDRYGDWLCGQFTSAGAEAWKSTLAELLLELLPCRGIHERSDVDSRSKEGLPPMRGHLRGEVIPEEVTIQEGACRFQVSLHEGHKTGFYLDQRDNRLLLPSLCQDAEVLNAFSYTGAFGLHALRGGARHVTQVDSSAPALEVAQRHLELNGFDAAKAEGIAGNAFQLLRKFRDAARSFDVIILDPPRLAESASQVERASRAYKDANLLACKLLRPGGLLLTFSCSGNISPELFQMIVAGAALDAGRNAQVLCRLGPAADHPLRLSFPEGAYLKGLLLQVD